ncbi:aquaporin [Nitrososphaera sp.]|uniref:MIP/aquaporin family protein n=1 Tax=Nitrososphaera sp. TaxID=1971748 RepID=UPI00307EB0E4
MANPRAWLAEAIGTYALVFFGPLSITIAIAVFGLSLGAEALLIISLGHGAVIGIMAYVFGHVSGTHINPAVTIAMMVTRRMKVADGAGYIGAQIVGAIAASATLAAVIPKYASQVKYGVQTGPSAFLDSSAGAGFAVEAILTFFLVTTIFLVAVHRKAAAGFAGAAIGTMIFLLHLVGVPLTGASMNPARTFGPAVISGYWDFHWIYWAGPIVGALAAAFIMNYVFVKKAEEEERQEGVAAKKQA